MRSVEGLSVENVILREPKARGGSDGTADATLGGCAAITARFSRLALLDGRMTLIQGQSPPGLNRNWQLATAYPISR
jgi:hypothetical protein